MKNENGITQKKNSIEKKENKTKGRPAAQKKNKMNDRRHTYRVDVYPSILKYGMWFMQNTRTPKCPTQSFSFILSSCFFVMYCALLWLYSIPFHIILFRSIPFRSFRVQFISTIFLDHTKWKRFCLSILFFVCASSFPST